MPKSSPLFPVLLLAIALPGGCAEQPAAFGPPTTLPKDKRAVEWDMPAKERLHVAATELVREPQEPKEATRYVGKTPPGWEDRPADPDTFRNLRWRVAGEPSTDCYLSVGVGGGVAMNMQRWYGQFGLPVADAAGLPKIPFLEGDGTLVELSGTFQGKGDQGMLLAFRVSGSRVTSLKFTGPAALVTQQREAFLQLAGSLRAAAPGERAEGPAKAGWQATTPVGWEERPADPATFRTLRWRVAAAAETDCYLSVGVGGGVAMNMQRWYGQFALPVADPATLAVVPFAGRDGRLVELSGTFQGKADRGMLLAFVNDGDQVTSLKFVGPATVVQEQKPAFLLLAASLRPGVGGGAVAPAASSVPAPAGAGGGDAAPFTATIPAGWTAKTGSAKPLHHMFGSDGEVYVSQLSGDVRQMLEIWRGELGLAAMDDAAFAAVPRCEMFGPDAWLLDVQGDYLGMTGKRIQGARVLVAVQKDGGTILFAKLIGSAADVAAQVDAFRAFCASLRRNP